MQRQNSPHHFLFSSTHACVHCAETELTTPFSIGCTQACVHFPERHDSPHHFLFSYTQACVHHAERQDSLHHFLFSSTQACVHHAERQDSPHHFLFSSTQACVHHAEREDSPNHFLLGSTRACVPEGRVDWKTAGRMIFPVEFLRHTENHPKHLKQEEEEGELLHSTILPKQLQPHCTAHY